MAKEVPKPPQPNERHTSPAAEMPLREVYKLPSRAILDAIYTGRIGDPEALRAYLVRQRTEFLQEFPDREYELDGSGHIGRWHGLVYSETVDEYAGLASFAESEVHRRSAGLLDTQAESPEHLQGVANFRRIADVWRQRAIRLSEAELDSRPSPETISTTPVVAGLLVERENQTEAPDYSRMQDFEVLNGIDNGTLTETEAVRVYVRKFLDSVRELYEGEELREQETEYAELVYGAPEDMIRLCLSQASEHLGYGVPVAAVSPAHYKIASRWYAMAGRFAQEAAQDHRDEDPQVNEEH